MGNAQVLTGVVANIFVRDSIGRIRTDQIG